jgi:hypothetical protein
MAVRPGTIDATRDHFEVPCIEIAARSISSSSEVHLEYVGRLLLGGDDEEPLLDGESDLAKRLELSDTARFKGMIPDIAPLGQVSF